MSDWATVVVAALAFALSPVAALATPVTSAANIPYSGIAPGGVDMATGEIIIVCRPDLALGGPMPLVFSRYYGSMLAREGLASSHLGTNWTGNFDWSFSMGPAGATVVTDRGRRIQFQQNPLGGYDLVSPTDEKYRLDLIGGSFRLTLPSHRRVYAFDGTSLALTTIYDEHGNSLSLGYAPGGLLSQVSDGLGRSLTFGYDPGGLLTQVSDGTRAVSFGYAGGLLASVTDAAGHTTSYVYAAPAAFAGLLQSMTEPMGNTPASCAYDPLGRIATMTDAFGHASSCSYDTPSGNAWTDALGHTWAYVHDAQSHLTGLVDPGPINRSFAYDALGRLTSFTRPLGDVTTFSYDAAGGLPASVTMGDGSVFAWSYSSHAAGGGAFYDLAGATYPDGATESFTRDAAGNLTNRLDRGAFHWLGTYNSRGQMLTATNPAGGVSTFTYDPEGRLASATDNAGHTTTFAFDAFDRLTQRTMPVGPPIRIAYDALDHPTSFTNELGKVWPHAYDANGRLMSETDPLLAQSSFSYDNGDRLIQATDALGHASMFAYDAAGRLASSTDRTGNTTQYQYDALGRLTRRLDPSGAPLQFSYDANGRLPAVQDALGHTMTFQYDALDRVTHTIDQLGVGRDYGYDPMGRLISASEPLGHTMSFGYDARGLLASFFDVTSEADFARTPLGEVSLVTDPNRHGWPASYDGDGRLASSTDPLNRMTSYGYDTQGRLAHVQLPLGSEDIGYDLANRVLARNFSDGTLLGYSWDDANRLAGGSGAAIGYDAAGRMTSSNGLTFAYDAEGRITSETYGPGKVVTYAYDSRGLVKTVMDWIGGTTSFGYDTTGALIALQRPDLTSASYAYDAAGRLSQQVEKSPPPIGSPLSSIAITRDALGRPTSLNRSQPLMPAVGASGSTVFSYDAASQINGLSWDPLGRLTGDGSRTFSWDGASRLTGFASGAEAPAFTYDAFGNPLSRTLNAVTEQYLWNYGRESPTLDMRSQGGTPQTYFIYTPDGMLLHSIDAASGARSFYHYDENGNTIFLTDGAGAVTTKYAYSPSGVVTTSGPASGNPFTFGGAGGAMQIGSGGIYRMGGNFMDPYTPDELILAEAGTMEHEIGHDFNLPHGGSGSGGIYDAMTSRIISVSGPPHHLSVMNHRYQFGGIPTRPPGRGLVIDPGPSYHDLILVIGDRIPVHTPEWTDLAPVRGSGIAEVDGNDLIVSVTREPMLLTHERILAEAWTAMHEMGHHVNLHHGGEDDDGLPSAWELSGSIDGNCDGMIASSTDGVGPGASDPPLLPRGIGLGGGDGPGLFTPISEAVYLRFSQPPVPGYKDRGGHVIDLFIGHGGVLSIYELNNAGIGALRTWDYVPPIRPDDNRPPGAVLRHGAFRGPGVMPCFWCRP